MNSLSSRSRGAAGFTLIEIIVSIAVLGLMMVGVAQVLSSTLSTTSYGYKHMDADTQARMVLDRMAFDISRITKRTDVDYYFKKNTTSGGAPNYGNDQMAFYSESGGYYPSGVTSTSGGGDVSLIGYMIAPMQNGAYSATGTPQLVRLDKGLSWNGFSSSYPAMVFNPSPTSITSNTITSTLWGNSSGTTATANNIANGQDPDYKVIGDQIFRMEFTFLVQTSPTGVQTNGQQNSTYKTYTGGYFYDNPWSATSTNNLPNGMKDVTAIVVSIAVLDNKSRATLGGNAASYLDTAAADLSDDSCSSYSAANPVNYNNSTYTTSGYLPLALWKTNLLSAAHLGLPKTVYPQVRFYQRFCYLNHVQ
jgi:prepilin-type N-terminal cleavage/methylation domain-containing protein